MGVTLHYSQQLMIENFDFFLFFKIFGSFKILNQADLRMTRIANKIPIKLKSYQTWL